MKEILQAAEQIVRKAGSLVRENIPEPKVLRSKPHGDLVTDGDLFVEEYVASALVKRFPDYGVYSEEGRRESPEAEYVWILDPIDGTKYYAKGVPLYSISLALARRGEPVLGVVYSPELDRMYCATTGSGAVCNGHAIHCSFEEKIENAAICLEIASRDSSPNEQKWAQERMGVLVAHGFRVRILGVAALGLCFCAAGGFDAYVNLTQTWKDWDVAAGRAILQEAGGEFTIVGGRIIAGPAALCQQIRSVLEV